MKLEIKKCFNILLISIVFLGFGSSLLDAQAFCALRDPEKRIKSFYPQMTSYRSIVKTIDSEIRQKVSEALPPQTLHYGELGRHTLYIAYKGNRPLGIVHVRSEQGKWGLVEVAWAIHLDLTVKGFMFQRCRDKMRNTLLASGFKERLVGQSFEDLKLYLDASGQGFVQGELDVDEAAYSLANVVLRSGLKTLLVTELAWNQEIENARVLALAVGVLPNADSIERLDFEVGMADSGGELLLDHFYRVRDSNDVEIGSIARTRVAKFDLEVQLDWILGVNRKVLRVDSMEWPDQDTQQRFKKLEGEAGAFKEDCLTGFQLILVELFSNIDALLAAES